MLATALAAALLGGLVFKGKSGWCGTLCPLAPVQKLYGQLPTIVVRNEYCSPCVGCQSNCYDFNPTAKLASDLYDRDQFGAGHRRFFAGIYPGFVLGYFTFGQFGVAGLIGFPLLSLGLFETIHAFTNATAYLLVVTWGMAAFATYYAFATPVVLRAVARVFGWIAPAPAANVIEAVIACAALGAIVASFRHERAWRRVRAEDDVVHVADGGESLRAHIADAALPAVFEQDSGRRFLVAPKQTLLEAHRRAGFAHRDRLPHGDVRGRSGARRRRRATHVAAGARGALDARPPRPRGPLPPRLFGSRCGAGLDQHRSRPPCSLPAALEPRSSVGPERNRRSGSSSSGTAPPE